MNTSIMRNDTLHDLTFIKMNVARFVGTGYFMITDSRMHVVTTKKTAISIFMWKGQLVTEDKNLCYLVRPPQGQSLELTINIIVV